MGRVGFYSRNAFNIEMSFFCKVNYFLFFPGTLLFDTLAKRKMISCLIEVLAGFREMVNSVQI